MTLKVFFYWLKRIALFTSFLLLIGFVCSTSITAQGESLIQGHLRLDSTWNRKVYLSYIPTFNDMYTMTNDMIIAESKIDVSGKFSINTEYLPTQEQLYRIHISRKGANAQNKSYKLFTILLIPSLISASLKLRFILFHCALATLRGIFHIAP